MSHHFGSTSAMDQRMISQVKSKIQAANIFVISKITCRACQQAKALLNVVVSGTGISPSFYDIDHFPQEKRTLLLKYLETGITTVPQVWINGRFIGGNDDVQRLHQMGRLVPLIGTAIRKYKIPKGLSSNNMDRRVRISPIKAHVLPLTMSNAPFGNTSSVLHIGDSKSRRTSYGRSQLSSSNNENVFNNRDLTRKLTISQSFLQPRERSFSYTGNVRANTNAISGLLSPTQRSTPISLLENGRNTQINFPSDERILRKSSVILQRNESGGRLRKGGPDYFTVSGWI